MEERRRSIRVNVDLACELEFGDAKYPAIISDISLGGARLQFTSMETGDPPPTGSECIVRFTTAWGPIETEATIRRISSSPPYAVGVTFDRMTEETARVFKSMVSDLLKDNLVQAHKMASLSEMVASITHEVNTPMGVIVMGASQLMESVSKLKDLFEGEQLQKKDMEFFLTDSLDACELILQNSRRVNELIVSFKKVSSDQASYQRRTFALDVYVGDILRSLKPRIKHSGHRVEVECEPGLTIQGYPGAFAQIVTNLLINAIMHGLEGMEAGVGCVRIEAEAKGEDWVIVRFSDNGRGMPAEHLARIFSPFFTSKRDEGGTGLGLNIVGNLVTDLLGGTIICESELGNGATFTIELPRVCPGGDEGPAVVSTSSHGKGVGGWWDGLG